MTDNSQMLTCSAETMLNYSSLCLTDHPPTDCYPENGVKNLLQYTNLSIGIVGNTLTLTAIPYAMRKKRWEGATDLS